MIGVPVSITDYDGTVAAVIDAACRRAPLLVTALAVHGVVEARTRPDVGRAVGAFDVVTPDGQPVRMALNLLHRAGLTDRVYGPTLTLRICAAAAAACLPVYFYGSTPAVVAALAQRLSAAFPGLIVAGAEPSLFRELTDAEGEALGRRIRASGAGLVFVGLGCPRQELFAHRHRDVIGLPQICVGAAFDFHAGTKRQAPRWMQDHALEWLFRLWQEPRRLVRRYAVTNTRFLLSLARQWAAPETFSRSDR
ncbi:polymer biosynthesis protein, WecB/TagA/CpsF family [Wenxinia saemankumensis]|uniref:Polymer biosynthesis protein, WecB/TagA/CpsF family n=1 Tax=Wenxinia saemankumensis TaxID=1447782 RepID=A0A1M6HYS8_9RHOB|nr:polymer biosynthesis protein, WecB/TagA/CpsF family [Wenxinia saemankumensis]